MSYELPELCRRWKDWSISANKSEDGWESDFPDWGPLMGAAEAAMLDCDDDNKSLIEFCWSISEESEWLADFAKERLRDCWECVMRLTSSPLAVVRWQAYSVLGQARFFGEQRLRHAQQALQGALADPDDYCKRRAILALAELHPADATLLAQPLMAHPDPYIRRAAVELANSAS